MYLCNLGLVLAGPALEGLLREVPVEIMLAKARMHMMDKGL